MADLGCGFAGLRVSFIPSRERIGRDFYMGIGQTDPQNPQTRKLCCHRFDYLPGTNRPRDNAANATKHGPSEASEGHE